MASGGADQDPPEPPGGDLFGAGAGAEGAAPKTKRPADLVSGHRARLRQRFIGGGEGSVADYELLELVLFRAIPRRDVKPLAKALLAEFGDFASVVSAEPARLLKVDGLGEAAMVEIKIVEAAAHALTRGHAIGREALDHWNKVIAYCRARLAHIAVEELHALFLDTKNRLIAAERLGQGTLDQVAIYPREVVKRALAREAAAVILAHNHPSGDPAPSRADIAMTARVKEALDLVGVRLLDHVIVGKTVAVSLAEQRAL